jgi:catechol 2,3-dioxygenase-like lactoylglutathione lyase family enzyme
VFDHVTIRVSDLEAARRFYELTLGALGFREPATDGHFFKWNDLSISTAREDRPLTRRAHVAVGVGSTKAVDDFWQAATGAGFADAGAPGPRPRYHAEYYGAFVLDPDGNSIEAVHHGFEPARMLDHLFLSVSDLGAPRRFYETVLSPLGHGFWASGDEPDDEEWVALGTRGSSLWCVRRRPMTENLHVAFAAPDNTTVGEFHRVALEAGYRDNGPPGERRYHSGYYGAFVLDPNGNNVEVVCHNR